MDRRECDCCNEPGIVKIAVTDLDGVLLDSSIYCKTCAEGALHSTGLEAPLGLVEAAILDRENEARHDKK